MVILLVVLGQWFLFRLVKLLHDRLGKGLVERKKREWKEMCVIYLYTFHPWLTVTGARLVTTNSWPSSDFFFVFTVFLLTPNTFNQISLASSHCSSILSALLKYLTRCGATAILTRAKGVSYVNIFGGFLIDHTTFSTLSTNSPYPT